MITDVVLVDSSGDSLQTALDRIEGLAISQNIGIKNKLYLRLIAEELFGLVRGLAGSFSGKFYAEGEDNDYRVVLEANAVYLNDIDKEKLIQISTTGINEDNIGIMSKIRYIFGIYLGGDDSTIAGFENYSLGLQEQEEKQRAWSLKKYKETVAHNKEAAANKDWDNVWDELERSVIANVADDIVVGIKNNTVKVEVYKTFS